jgi:hypothetical protein
MRVGLHEQVTEECVEGPYPDDFDPSTRRQKKPKEKAIDIFVKSATFAAGYAHDVRDQGDYTIKEK